jgi:hypothetical protein
MKGEKDIGKQLSTVVRLLNERGTIFAICGGLAGGLYRPELRLTADIDVIIASADLNPCRVILNDLGLNCLEISEEELAGGPLFAIKNRSSPIQMLAGRDPADRDVIGVDFLLPTIPWVKRAVERAQSNVVRFGTISAPAITLEDFIIAKLYAMRVRKPRFKDLDDLEQVFRPEMDFIYLCSQLEGLGLKIPEILSECVPERLKMFLRK